MGTLTVEDGTIYHGMFRQDKLHGTCVIRRPGTKKEEYWEYKRDKKVRQLTIGEFQQLNTYTSTFDDE
jgi:hypothetical protein